MDETKPKALDDVVVVDDSAKNVNNHAYGYAKKRDLVGLGSSSETMAQTLV